MRTGCRSLDNCRNSESRFSSKARPRPGSRCTSGSPPASSRLMAEVRRAACTPPPPAITSSSRFTSCGAERRGIGKLQRGSKNPVGLFHQLLQPPRLLARGAAIPRQHEAQVVRDRLNGAERLAQLVRDGLQEPPRVTKTAPQEPPLPSALRLRNSSFPSGDVNSLYRARRRVKHASVDSSQDRTHTEFTDSAFLKTLATSGSRRTTTDFETPPANRLPSFV